MLAASRRGGVGGGVGGVGGGGGVGGVGGAAADGGGERRWRRRRPTASADPLGDLVVTAGGVEGDAARAAAPLAEAAAASRWRICDG